MANTAFNAKFRIVDNNSDRENAPEKNLIIDISVEEAMKMANWLSAMVDNAHVEDTTIRIYKSKSEYDESSIAWEPCVVWTRYSLTVGSWQLHFH